MEVPNRYIAPSQQAEFAGYVDAFVKAKVGQPEQELGQKLKSWSIAIRI